MPTSPEEKALGWVSITEVLDIVIEPGLVAWKLKVGAKEAKRLGTIALKIGKRVHELIEIDWKKGSYKFGKNDPIEVRNCLQAWEDFKRDYQPEILDMEFEVKDEERKVLGHRDMRARVLGQVFTIDLKTSGRINEKKYWLQANEYQGIAKDSEGSAILRLDKSLGIYEWKSRLGFDEYLRGIFNSKLNIYHFYKEESEDE